MPNVGGSPDDVTPKASERRIIPMLKMNRRNFAWLLAAFIAVGCGNSGDQQSAGSAIEGLFGPSDAEKANSKQRDAQTQRLKNQADQMQKDRLDSYQ